MSGHTPGPWEAFYKAKYDEWHVSVPLQGRTTRLGLFPDGCPTERPEADARLIAAAPELLDELQAMTDAYAKVMKDAGVTGYPEALATVRKARAAIAKATGSGS